MHNDNDVMIHVKLMLNHRTDYKISVAIKVLFHRLIIFGLHHEHENLTPKLQSCLNFE